MSAIMKSARLVMSSSFILFALLVHHTHSHTDGTAYIRWGRTTCRHDAEVVYTGYIAGSHYNQVGSGANYLCLHDHPQWGRSVSGKQVWSAMIYGVEYELLAGYANNKPFSYANNGGHNLHNQDAVCVVCYVHRSHNVMIPGRLDCTGMPHWVREYSGYLMSQAVATGRNKAEYICVDEAPEARPGGGADNNEGVLYPVQVGCGSLPCPDYVENYEVTCVVCSK